MKQLYRILIVDDETRITALLDMMLSEHFGDTVDIYTTNSTQEALYILRHARIDIIISDIQMPGKSGLELIEISRSLWQKTKFIFLSAYSDFEYMHKALKFGADDYILKSDSDEKIIAAIYKAMRDIDSKNDSRNLLNAAEIQSVQELPMVKKEYLKRILYGFVTEPDSTFSFNIDLSQPVYLLVAHPDRDTDLQNLKQRLKYEFYLQKLADMYFSSHFNIEYTEAGDERYVWLLQPNTTDENIEYTTFICEKAVSVQEQFGAANLGTISFCCSDSQCSIFELEYKFDLINKALSLNSHSSYEMMLIDTSPPAADVNNKTLAKLSEIRKINLLSTHLYKNDREAYFAELENICKCLENEHSIHSLPAIELYNTTALCIISYINQLNLYPALSQGISLTGLYDISSINSWTGACDYLIDVSKRLFDMTAAMADQSADNIIQKIYHYIETHLDENLSLISISDAVHLNSSYLSRLFRAKSGHTISEFIAQRRLSKAKELLSGSDIKVYEIASQLGFGSANYFSRFFKKATNMSPEEYRKQKYNN